MHNNQIIFTGGNGFIGRHLIQSLEKNSNKVFKLSSHRELKKGLSSKDLNFQYLFENNKNLKNVKVAYLLGWGEMKNPASDYHIDENVNSSKNLISELYSNGIDKIIFLGSATEYGERKGLLSENNHSEGLLTKYAEGKMEVAKFGFEMAMKYEKTFLHIRLFYTYGPFQRKSSLINYLINCYGNNEKPKLGSGNYYRDYIYLSDAIKGIILLSNTDESLTINLGSGSAVEVKEFVSELWRILGGDIADIQFGSRPMKSTEPKQQYAYADISLMKKIIKWSPGVSLTNGLKKTLASIKDDVLY
jgi:nucleoside-diphosphate-sugar epimerase